MSRAIRLLTLGFLLIAGTAAGGDPMPAPAVLPTPPPSIRFAGGDGTSCARAVVIAGAEHERDGVRAQRWWIYTKHPGARIVRQASKSESGRDFDTIEILEADGSPASVCFDISSFYGKP